MLTQSPSPGIIKIIIRTKKNVQNPISKTSEFCFAKMIKKKKHQLKKKFLIPTHLAFTLDYTRTKGEKSPLGIVHFPPLFS